MSSKNIDLYLYEKAGVFVPSEWRSHVSDVAMIPQDDVFSRGRIVGRWRPAIHAGNVVLGFLPGMHGGPGQEDIPAHIYVGINDLSIKEHVPVNDLPEELLYIMFRNGFPEDLGSPGVRQMYIELFQLYGIVPEGYEYDVLELYREEV